MKKEWEESVTWVIDEITMRKSKVGRLKGRETKVEEKGDNKSGPGEAKAAGTQMEKQVEW